MTVVEHGLTGEDRLGMLHRLKVVMQGVVNEKIDSITSAKMREGPY